MSRLCQIFTLLSVLSLTAGGLTVGAAPRVAAAGAGTQGDGALSRLSTEPDAPAVADCPVTPYAAEGLGDAFTATWYGSDVFWAGLDRTFQGVWYAEPGFMKVQWRRPAGEQLSVEGQRLDAPASPLEVEVLSGYGGGFQVSALTFPTDGCWEIVGRIPDQELRFVVYVHPGHENPINNPLPAPAPDLWDTVRRPLELPVAADSACPRTDERRVDRIASTVSGPGPVYAQGLGSDGRVRLGDAHVVTGEFAVPVRWLSSPEYLGPILIRGRQIDGPNDLRFRETTPQEVQIGSLDHLQTPDWRVWGWPSHDILVPAPGCYALQIDGLDFTAVIVFEAVESSIPEPDAAPQP